MRGASRRRRASRTGRGRPGSRRRGAASGPVASARASSSFLSPPAPRSRRGGLGVGGQADQRQDLRGARRGPRLRIARLRAEVRGDGDVLQDGQLAEGARDLEGPGDAPVADGVRREARRSPRRLKRMEPGVGVSAPDTQLNTSSCPSRWGRSARGSRPRCTAKETALRAVKPPKRLVRRPGYGEHGAGAGAGTCRRPGERRGLAAPAGRQRAAKGDDAGRRTGGFGVAMTLGQTMLGTGPRRSGRRPAMARSFWPRIGMPSPGELHAVALHGAALGDVGLAGGLGEGLRAEAAVLLDRPRHHVVEQDPHVVEAHRHVGRDGARRGCSARTPCSA